MPRPFRLPLCRDPAPRISYKPERVSRINGGRPASSFQAVHSFEPGSWRYAQCARRWSATASPAVVQRARLYVLPEIIVKLTIAWCELTVLGRVSKSIIMMNFSTSMLGVLHMQNPWLTNHKQLLEYDGPPTISMLIFMNALSGHRPSFDCM